MANFFVNRDDFLKDPVMIEGEEANHIIKVLRMKAGEKLTLFDKNGSCADGEIVKIEDKKVFVKVDKRYLSETEPELKITLFQAVPKNPKMDLIVQKATELGVTSIVPCNTKRCVAKIEKDAKTERLRRIAFEAAKQCGRAYVPKIYEPVSFDEAIELISKLDAAIIPYECEKGGKITKEIIGNAKTLGIMIGPEGGFEEAEVEKAENAGVMRVTLGKRILRTETAGLISSALCLYLSGDME